mmetsp:Transcript_1424/g.5521  ORF Transcript_1424/g.5521 Transcript_1424/m.5521 type:complete len:318 (+) Transcript_1424:356-1309(+)
MRAPAGGPIHGRQRETAARSVVLVPREDALEFEARHEHADALFDGHFVVLEVDLGRDGLLVGRVDAREARDLARVDLGVQSFGVAVAHDVEVDVHVHFEELQALVDVALARRVAVGAVRRDEGDERDDAARVEEARHLADAAHRFGAVGGREGQVAVEPGAHVVAVEHLDVLAMLEHEFLLERARDGRFARPREPRHPERDALLVERGEAFGRRQMARLLRAALARLGALDDVRRRRRQRGFAVRRDVERRGLQARGRAAAQHVHDGQQNAQPAREKLAPIERDLALGAGGGRRAGRPHRERHDGGTPRAAGECIVA